MTTRCGQSKLKSTVIGTIQNFVILSVHHCYYIETGGRGAIDLDDEDMADDDDDDDDDDEDLENNPELLVGILQTL